MSDALRELAVLSQQLVEAEKAVETAEKALSAAKAKVTSITEEDIPGLMSELGVEELKLETGETIKVDLVVYCSITEAKKDAAYKWLEDNGFGSLIETVVGLAFSREETKAALEYANKLRAEGKEPEVEQSVHASRLKSFLKEQLGGAERRDEQGNIIPLPLDLFGARPVKTAKLKAPKVAKPKKG